MSGPSQFYLDRIQKSSSGYRAMWYPGTALKIGDIVKLDRYGVVAIQTSLEKLHMEAEVRIDDSSNELDYSSGDQIEITAKASGAIPAAGSALTNLDAGFNIKFNTDKSIIFTVSGYKTYQIVNLHEIEKAALARVNSGDWEKDWLIVTNLIVADSATIIIAEKGGTALDLKASGAVSAGEMKITDTSLGLSVARESGSTEKFIAQGGLTPLYKVMGLVSPLFGKTRLDVRELVAPVAEDKMQLQEFEPETGGDGALEIDGSEI